MPKEQNWSLVVVASLNYYGYEKLSRLGEEITELSAIDSSRTVLVKKDARARYGFWEIPLQPKAPCRAGGGPPGVPCVLSIVLAEWVETMNGNDA